jgi:hypothetical protein
VKLSRLLSPLTGRAREQCAANFSTMEPNSKAHWMRSLSYHRAAQSLLRTHTIARQLTPRSTRVEPPSGTLGGLEKSA